MDNNSYYWQSTIYRKEYPELAEPINCDICIIGAGYTGLSASIPLAEKGYKVVVLERNQVGSGASGLNGGHICSGYTRDMREVAKQLGLSWAKQLWHLSEEAKKLLYQRIEQNNIVCDLQLGYLYGALDQKQLHDLKNLSDFWAENFNYHKTTLLDKESCQQEVASPRFVGGMIDWGGGHLHPRNLCCGLAKVATNKGVQIYENSPGEISIYHRYGHVVTTPQAEVQAQTVIMATGAYMTKVEEKILASVVPVTSFVGATQPFDEAVTRQLIPHDLAVSDWRFIPDYFRFSADRRLIYGGGLSYTGRTPSHLEKQLKDRILQTFPQLAEHHLEMHSAWSGRLSLTMNRLPLLYRLQDGLYIAQGFSGQGLSLSILAGQMVAEAVMGDMERFDVWSKIPHHPFPGGKCFRRPLLALGMMYYRLKDVL